MTYEGLRLSAGSSQRLAAHRADKDEMPGIRTSATDLYKRALDGDASAKNEIEAQELMKKADDVTLSLRERAAKGDQTAMVELRRRAAGSTSPTSAKPAGSWAPVDALSRFTQADIDKAVTTAVASERSRTTSVFASPASYGRERGCARLLASHHGWSAAAITRELPHLPKDRELAARAAEAAHVRTDAVWDRARAATEGQLPQAGKAREGGKSATSSRASDDVWGRAYAAAERGL